jgi:ribose 5-phosphate isomerase B
MNLLCLGGRVIGFANTEEMIMAFLNAEFSGAERGRRRLQKIKQLEH